MALIRVFEVPPPTGNFHFGGGEPVKFVEVDWFRDDGYPLDGTAQRQTELEAFIRAKGYFEPSGAYLVLHPEHTFTIGYTAP